jgi:uncharacterized protein YbjQ (UPF0145 family)
MGGKIVAGVQSMFGGEISSFSSEIEKARIEAMNRIRSKAEGIGANGIIGLDMETTNLGSAIVIVSATGTAVILEPEYLHSKKDYSSAESIQTSS